MEKKVIISQDKQAIERDIYPYERKAWYLNLFIDRMEAIGYPVESPEHILTVLQTGVEQYIRTQLVDGAELSIGGLRLKREAILAAVELPNLDDVQSVESGLKQYHKIPMDSLAFENGRFTVPEELKQRIIDQHTYYARNEKQAAIFQEAQKVVKAVNSFHSKFGPTLNPDGSSNRSYHEFKTIESILHWNAKDWKYEVDTFLIRKFHGDKGDWT